MAGGTAGFQSNPTTLEGLNVYEGTVQEISMKHINNEMQKNEAGRNIVAFTVSGSDMKFGIYEQLERYANYFIDLQVGDSVKVYYSSHRMSPEGFNLDVVQIEKKGVGLIDLAENRKENNLVAYAILVAGFVFFIHKHLPLFNKSKRN